MHATLTSAPQPPSSTGSVVLHDVSWQIYESILNDLKDHHVSLTYDRGTLEIMSPSRTHDFGKKLIARLIETMADELYIDIVSGGSTTCRREDLERGLEPDELYYFKNAARMLNRDEELNLTRAHRRIWPSKSTSPPAQWIGSRSTRRWASLNCGAARIGRCSFFIWTATKSIGCARKA